METVSPDRSLHSPANKGTHNLLPDFARLVLPCCKSSFVVPSVDSQPLWTVEDLFAELKALELKVGDPTVRSPSPLKQSVTHFKQSERVFPQEGVMVMKDKTCYGTSLVGGWRMSAPDFSYSDSEESDDNLPNETSSCLMEKQSLEKDILFELELENQLQVKEELRCKLAKLKELQRNESNRTASSITRLSEYIDERQELDRKLDKQYRRKIAEVLDEHLSAVQRDHEQKSQIEERRIRDDAALEEAKKKALLEEKLRQEKAKAEAEAKHRAAKMAEEVERAAQEAAQRAAKEAAEREAARNKEAVASEEAKKKSMNNNEEIKEISSKLPTEMHSANRIKVLSTDAALKAEATRLNLYNEVAEKSNLISKEELDSRSRQISKRFSQINGTVENVRAKAEALLNTLRDPACPSSVSMILLAKKVVSLCEKPSGSFDAFPCGHVILLVSAQVPSLIDLVLAELHKNCIYTVPKYLQPSKQALKNNDYWKMVGYREENGKLESTSSYLERMQSYVKLFAAILQTETEGITNPHGLGDGWTWLARFLNTMPANNTTAAVLTAFLEMAGFALHRKYRSQFRKVLDVISRNFLPALKEKIGQTKEIKKLEDYLERRLFLEEPVGWRLLSSSSVMSKVYI